MNEPGETIKPKTKEDLYDNWKFKLQSQQHTTVLHRDNFLLSSGFITLSTETPIQPTKQLIKIKWEERYFKK